MQDGVLFVNDDDLVSFTEHLEIVPQPCTLRTLRERDWKLTRYLDPSGQAPEEHELYDLEHDPYEMSNLAAQVGEDPDLR